MKNFKLVALCLSLFPFSLYAKEVVIATGDNIAPYAIASQDSGAEIEIFREAFKTQGMSVKFEYIPLGRVSEVVDVGANSKIDGSDRNYSPKHPEYFTNPYIKYEGCVITNADAPKFTSLNELFNSTKVPFVIGFQGAHLSFGKDFHEITLKHKDKYREVNEQKQQAVALGKKSGDAVVADVHIIRYKMENDPALKEYKAVKIGCNIDLINEPYKAYFKDEAIRKAFNTGLAIIVKNGEYEKIIKKYELASYKPE